MLPYGAATETSTRYRNLCCALTQAGHYTEAEWAIEEAIKHLKPVCPEGRTSRAG